MKTRAELKTLAKAQMKPFMGMTILCTLLMQVLLSVPSGASSVLGYPWVGTIIAILITGPLNLGLMCIFLGLTKGEAPTAGKLFEGFNYFKNSFLLQLLMGIFIFLWSLLLVIPGIIKSFSYSMAFYILAENPEMDPREALKQSQEMMDGHKMDLFVLELSFIPWILLMAVTCGLAGLYVIPYMQATVTNFYLDIKGQEPILEAAIVE